MRLVKHYLRFMRMGKQLELAIFNASRESRNNADSKGDTVSTISDFAVELNVLNVLNVLLNVLNDNDGTCTFIPFTNRCVPVPYLGENLKRTKLSFQNEK